jgi:carotenoid cleavage dioxygenase-like enzyme
MPNFKGDKMPQSRYETSAVATIDAYEENPLLSGNFRPIDFETTAYVLPVKGQIPRELTGRLVRIGPNPSDAIDRVHHHWFAGIGMLHGVRLTGGRAEWYRSRYVRAGTAAESIGLTTTPGDKNESEYCAVNTHVVRAGDRMFAVVEAGGLPVELSYELDSLCRSDLQGGAKLGFAAHPKMDPFTGELHALA